MKMTYLRLVLTGAVFAIALSGVRAADQSKLPPANVFDMAEMRNPDTLDLKILSDEIALVSENSAEKIRCIKLEFFSQNWGGEDVRHLAKVYLPVGLLPTIRVIITCRYCCGPSKPASCSASI